MEEVVRNVLADFVFEVLGHFLRRTEFAKVPGHSFDGGSDFLAEPNR